ncbi:MAG: type I methionyl aminopeptidase [Spirochaetaceae bacterium]|nr:type I methionyl aminopeptidase [Spirochaetaceae bacterium]
MIRYKNAKQIEGIRESCAMLCAMFKELVPLVKPGIETIALDKWAQNWISKAGGKPAFLGYGPSENPFPAALCISVNEEVIHGIPSKRKLKSGDLVGIDAGITYNGFVSDKAVTLEVEQVSPEAHRLNIVTKECLYKAVAAAKAGGRIHQIGHAVSNHAKAAGFGVVREFCGHGVGFEIHEDPQVSNTAHDGPNPRMREGMVLAIEPMLTMGDSAIEILNDSWTVVTRDAKPSAHWEHTIAIFSDHTEILTE